MNVSADHLAEFRHRYLAALEKATCLVLGGTLPLGAPVELYRQAIEQARARGIPVIFDSSGAALKAGIEARPSIIKPNQEELGELLGSLPTSLTEIGHAAWELQKMYETGVIVTLGSKGALAVLGENSYQIPPLSLPVASSAGAGDGVLAGMALALSRGEPPENGLRYGFALAAAVVQTLATADFRIEDYKALLPQIELIPLPPW